jgi:hypothetical protein
MRLWVLWQQQRQIVIISVSPQAKEAHLRSTILLVVAALTLAATTLVAYSPAHAVVCAKGVYRAGCVGPNGAVVTKRAYVRPYRYHY